MIACLRMNGSMKPITDNHISVCSMNRVIFTSAVYIQIFQSLCKKIIKCAQSRKLYVYGNSIKLHSVMQKTITTRDELIHLADTGDFYSSGVSLVHSRISPVCRPHWATDDEWRRHLALTTLNTIGGIHIYILTIMRSSSFKGQLN